MNLPDKPCLFPLPDVEGESPNVDATRITLLLDKRIGEVVTWEDVQGLLKVAKTFEILFWAERASHAADLNAVIEGCARECERGLEFNFNDAFKDGIRSCAEAVRRLAPSRTPSIRLKSSPAKADRNAIIEECAEMCESIAHDPRGENHGERVSCNHAAYACYDALRALKDKP